MSSQAINDIHHARAIVVGAGPAGMTAAARLAEAAIPTLLVDEQTEPGGQIYRSVTSASENRRCDVEALGASYHSGTTLAQRLANSDAQLWTRTQVWDVSRDRDIWMARGGKSYRLKPEVLILASGAMERPMPVPGWTLDGVMTAGALQLLIKSSGAVPAAPPVLVGSGPLLLLLAQQLIALGVGVRALVDTTPHGRLWKALAAHPGALLGRGPSYLLAGIGLTRSIKRARIPWYRGCSGIEIDGWNAVERIRFRCSKRQHEIEADLVALHQGVISSQPLARLAECEFRWNEHQQHFVPAVAHDFQSTVPGIFIAGDGAAISGSKAAELQGEAAALGALAQLKPAYREHYEELAVPFYRALAAEMRIRPFLDAAFAPDPELNVVSDEVTVCRCENVNAGQIRAEIRRGTDDIGAIKAALRCGMGPCQGRTCGPVVTRIVVSETGRDPSSVGTFVCRPPIKPLRISELIDVRTNIPAGKMIAKT